MAIDFEALKAKAKKKDEATESAASADFAKAKQTVTVPQAKATPLMTALSTNKTAGVTTNKNTNYKPLAAPTSAQKMADVGINFKPTMQSQINTINGISNKTITPTPMVQDKVTDTDVERGFYALGNAISPNKANTVGSGLRYDLARGVTGTVGAVEGVTDFVVGGLNNVGSTITSLGGTKPNAVSQFFDRGAQYVYDNDVAGAMRKGIDDKVGDNKNWSSNITGELWDMAGNIIAASGTGKAASKLAKVSAPILSKATFGISQGGSGAQQAYNEGATTMQAAGYGNVIAAATIATESMFGGVPAFGKGVLDDLIKGLDKSPKAMQALVDMVGEGGEEAVQTYITPYLQRIYYNPEAKNATINEMLTSFAYGAGLSGIMQAPSVIGSIGTKPNISSDNVQYTAQTGENNVQKQTLPMQNTIAPNLPKAVDNQTNAKAVIDTNVNTNIPNVNVQENVNKPQQAVQAPINDFKSQTATDTAKAVEVDTAEQVKPEVQTQGELQEQNINSLREQRAEIEAWLDTPFALDSPAETRKYENQLTKVNAEIDKAVEEERRAAVKTPLKTIIDNLDKYRRSDLESLAEQLSGGNGDGYEDFSRAELEESLRDLLNERAGDFTTLELQAPKYGLFVRPIEAPQAPSLFPSNSLGAKLTTAKAVEVDTVEQSKAEAQISKESQSAVGNIKDEQLKSKVEREISNKAWEKAFNEMGYITLSDKEHAENQYQKDGNNLLGAVRAKSDFDILERKYQYEYSNDNSFINSVVDKYNAKENQRNHDKIVEDSFSKPDWQVPQSIMIERVDAPWKKDTIIREHKQSVINALNSGENVPSDVLQDYPDLSTQPNSLFPADSLGAKITTDAAQQVNPEAQAWGKTQPAITEKSSVVATDKELLAKANEYTDEYYMPLDDATTDEEFKTWRSIRDKMVAKYRSENKTTTEVVPKYEVGQYVVTEDGKEGKVSGVTMFEGIPSYSITTDDGDTYSAIKQFYLTDISKSKPVRDSFVETITNKAQKTKALDYLKSKGTQDKLDKLADAPESRSEKHDYTHSTKDGKDFTTSKYRIYSGENNGKTFIEVSKVAFDYFNFKKSQPTPAQSLFPANSLGAKITSQPKTPNALDNGFGAIDRSITSDRYVGESYREATPDEILQYENAMKKYMNSDEFKKVRGKNPSPQPTTENKSNLPQGTGAASKGSQGGMGATKPTRFPVNDDMNVDLNNLPQMSNQVVMNPQSKKGDLKTNLSNAYTHIVDTLNPIVKFSKATGDNTAMLASNSANAGGTVSHIFDNALVDMNGNKIGTSLKEIAKKIPKGQEVDFWNYMMQRRNINKAVEDKNVIANFNSRMSAQYAKEVESRNPAWKSTGDAIVKWIADFEQAWGVNSGLVDQELFNQLKLKDPNYVPAQREFTELESALTGGEVGKKFVDQRTPLKTMQGSERDINNPLENIMRLVNTTVKSARYNQVGQSLLKTLRSNPKASQYGEIVSEGEAKVSRANNIVAVIENGQKQYIRINDVALLDALNGIPKSTYTVPVISNLTTGFKRLTTQDNPLFGITNLARDLPTGYIYGSQWNPFTYLLNEGKAFGQIAKNGANYQRYKAVGGGMSSFFSSADAETAALNMNKTKNVFQKVGIGFNKFNSMIEEATRLNEFSAVLSKTGDVQKALNAANDVTVNFSRGGDIIKTVDRNGVPYLNASIQGLDKLGKAFKPDRIAKTLLTGAVGITLPTLILYLFNRDNPYYDELSNRAKDNYFCLPNLFGELDDNGKPMTFIKLPKSRELGIIFGALAERIARAVDGEEEAFKGFGGALATNIAPTNPIESGLIAPIVGLKSNKDFAGRTIIPESMQDRSKHLQFDEKTSELTKFIAEYAAKAGVELSPKEMDYLIDSWTGVVGDFLLPATTKGANALSPITNKFTADPRYSSQTISNFYEKMDEAAKMANDKNFAEGLDSETVTLEEKISSNYAKASKEISALSKASARAGVEKLTDEDVKLLKEYGIDTSAKAQDIQKAIRTEQNKIASAAISRGTKADEMELDLNNDSDIAKKVEKYQSAGITQKQAYDFYKSTADIDSDDKYSMVKLISGKGYTDTQAIALVGTLYTDSSKESMLPYLTTSKHLLSLYLTNKDTEMISMTIPAKVTKDNVDYELTDAEKELFKTTYANYFNSRVTNVSSADAVKSLRGKAFDAAKAAVIQNR